MILLHRELRGKTDACDVGRSSESQKKIGFKISVEFPSCTGLKTITVVEKG